ncbi:MAG TPA: hypothetical protein VGF59_09680 [Bryobacteraceae bacterium]
MKPLAIIALTVGTLGAQRLRSPQRDFPPDIVVERFIDAVHVAPHWFSVQTVNPIQPNLRVLHAKLPGEAKVALHDSRSGFLVAITDVHLRLRTADNKFRDLHVSAGESRWLDADTHTVENLNNRDCEYVFVEMRS